MTLSDAAREALTRKQLFQELKMFSASRSVIILIDNQTAFDISDNSAKYRQAKHIDIRYHAVKHYVQNDKIEVNYISSNHQSADILTKAFELSKHHRFYRMIELCNSYETFENVHYELK